jgi:hypothetical protein
MARGRVKYFFWAVMLTLATRGYFLVEKWLRNSGLIADDNIIAPVVGVCFGGITLGIDALIAGSWALSNFKRNFKDSNVRSLVFFHVSMQALGDVLVYSGFFQLFKLGTSIFALDLTSSTQTDAHILYHSLMSQAVPILFVQIGLSIYLLMRKGDTVTVKSGGKSELH